MNHLKLVVVGPSEVMRYCFSSMFSVENLICVIFCLMQWSRLLSIINRQKALGESQEFTIECFRIIEYEQSVSCKGKMHKVEVELWDTSGSKRYEQMDFRMFLPISYENCWPAVFRGLNGVVFVYNPNDTGHGKVLEEWQSILAQIQTLRDTQCCVIGHCKSSKTDRDVSLPLTFSRYLQFKGSISEEGEKFREEFAKFISQLVSTRMEANEQEELNIINS
ncbi:putative protein putative vertebrate RAB member RAS oncogene family 5 [Fasciola hepatica]|uniref:Ras family protein n=1 Tax=Fasciola hepatica TaxID=6192 RepID=A0A4E0S288_FASHE|nr:putative protein putative vertebrate RAB member RAS oncogene family 5 [Fasciola hepatica]